MKLLIKPAFFICTYMSKPCPINAFIACGSRFAYWLGLLLYFFFFPGVVGVQAQVVAAFRATDTAGCAPLIIRFHNVSTGATSYSWNLGNSTTSSLKDVSASYLTAGTYTVTLTASDGVTTADSSIVIRVYGKPVVSFTASDTSVCPGVPITFTSTSTPNAWGGLAYTWNFGDGTSYPVPNPTYAYGESGRYSVTLFVMNTKGCINTLGKTGFINIFDRPSAQLSAPATFFCKSPATVPFSTLSTGKSPIAHSWSFGDGGISSATNPMHTYSGTGLYNLKLVVTDGHGCKDSLLQSSYIGIGNFKTEFSSPANGCLHGAVQFANTGSPRSNAKWDFGDGTNIEDASDTIFHTYTLPGSYVVKMIATNDTCTDSVTHTINIVQPAGSFTASQVCLPVSTVDFTATAAPGVAVDWDFGDKTTGTGTAITHTYHPPPFGLTFPPPDAPYQVSMILTDALGCKDTVTRADTIKNLRANMAGTFPRSGCAPLAVSFRAKTEYFILNEHQPCISCMLLVFPYPYATASYSWNFGDGSPVSSGVAPVHSYTAPGVYIATCTIVTANGCTASDIMKIEVGTKPVASCTVSKTRACAGQPITYVSTSTPSSVINFYEWNFGDGVIQKDIALKTITHRSEMPGVHNVRFVVYYNGCESDAYEFKDTIDGPNAHFTNTYTCNPANGMAFTKTSTGDDTHLWQFGDGATSTADNPVHYYPAIADYPVTLSTYNATTGCRDTNSILIKLERLKPTLSPYYSALCRDAIDSFTTFIAGADSTWPLKSYWYLNGSLTDVHSLSPAPYPLSPLVPPPNFYDTVYRPMRVRGNNNIMLVTSDNHNCRDTALATVLVAKPKANFSFSPATVCPSSAVNFADLSTDVPGISIAKYSWSFGDKTTAVATVPLISHTYTLAGAYTVREIVTDNIGCSDTFTHLSKPVVHRPKAGFVASSTYTCKSTTINFANTSVGSIRYLWSFGDGSTTTVSVPVHTYTVAGSYDVQLVAYDAYGCTDTLYQPNYVLVNPLPVASFHMDDSFAVCPPLNVNFINTSTGATFNQWSFGDGSYSVEVYPNAIYIAPGDYKVELKVSNPYGCIDTASAHVRVFGYVGAFSYTPDTVCASAPVNFSASLSGVINIVWDFNDGFISPPSLSNTIAHNYTVPGSYMPKLILTDLAGCTKFSLGADTIKVDSVVAMFGAKPDPVCANNSITFKDSSYSYFSSSRAWLWTFGSGATSTVRAPVYAFSVAGTQPVTLQVTDGLGCTATTSGSVTVLSQPDTITGPTVICIAQPAALSNSTAGGVWSSSNTSVAVIGSAGIVTGFVPGTTNIAYTLSSGCRMSAVIRVAAPPASISGAKRVCMGAATTLTNAVAGGSWSSGNTAIATIGSTGVVSSIAAGTVVITYQMGTGCASYATVTVEPTPSVISGTATVCTGDSITLTNTISGGTWTSAATTVATIAGTTGILKGVAAGTTNITYTLGSGCTATGTFTVLPLVLPVTGVASICEKTTAVLSDAATGGAWSSSSPAIAVIDAAGTVTGITAGTATVSYTLVSGCSATKNITINPLPAAITGITEVCVSAITTLSNATAGGTWTGGGTVAAIGGSTGVVAGLLPGTAAVTYTLSTGCTATASVIVHPLPDPITGSVNLCDGLTGTLVNAIPGGNWSSTSPLINVDAAGGVVTALAMGTATVSYTLPTGCYVTTTVTIHVLPPAITGTTLVCAGAVTTLVNTMGAGLWSSSDAAVATVGATGIVTGVMKGTAHITYASPAGCIAVTTVTVNPVITPISGTGSLCKGKTTTLSSAIGGGTWTSSNTAIATISAAGVVTGVAAGTTIISYSALNTCDTATLPVSINPLPDAGTISGTTTLCAGASGALSNSVAGGVWSGSSGSIAIVDAAGTVTGVASGTVVITYTYSNSCGAAMTSSSLTINPLPGQVHITTHPDSVMCGNSPFQNFGADIPAGKGIQYTWFAENASVYATSADRQYCLVNFGRQGQSMVKLSARSLSTGCASADSLRFSVSAEERTATVVIYYSPEFICKDNTAESFQWGYDDAYTLDSVLLPGMVNQNYQNASPDFSLKHYWVLTRHNNCLQKSYYNVPLGIGGVAAAGNHVELLLYPNPAGEKVNIEVMGMGGYGMIKARLIDMTGRERGIISIIGGTGTFDLNGLPQGVYTIAVSRDGMKLSSKTFVKN